MSLPLREPIKETFLPVWMDAKLGMVSSECAAASEGVTVGSGTPGSAGSGTLDSPAAGSAGGAVAGCLVWVGATGAGALVVLAGGWAGLAACEGLAGGTGFTGWPGFDGWPGLTGCTVGGAFTGGAGCFAAGAGICVDRGAAGAGAGTFDLGSTAGVLAGTAPGCGENPGGALATFGRNGNAFMRGISGVRLSSALDSTASTGFSGANVFSGISNKS